MSKIKRLLIISSWLLLLSMLQLLLARIKLHRKKIWIRVTYIYKWVQNTAVCEPVCLQIFDMIAALLAIIHSLCLSTNKPCCALNKAFVIQMYLSQASYLPDLSHFCILYTWNTQHKDLCWIIGICSIFIAILLSDKWSVWVVLMITTSNLTFLCFNCKSITTTESQPVEYCSNIFCADHWYWCHPGASVTWPQMVSALIMVGLFINPGLSYFNHNISNDTLIKSGHL